MTFNVTGWIDFSPDNNAWQLSLVTARRPLINETELLKRLLPEDSDARDLRTLRSRYRHGLQRGTFRFSDYAFRRQYLKWIYSRFSDSLANHRMVQQDERACLTEWAKQFNQVHRHLKIIRIAPQSSQTELMAHLLMIGFSRQHRWSFNLRRAFTIEYRSDWPVAFERFELNEGQRMVKVMQAELNQDIPDGRFRFTNGFLAAEQLARLKPDFHPRTSLPKLVKLHHPSVRSSSSASVTRSSRHSSDANHNSSSLVSRDSSWVARSSAQVRTIVLLTADRSSAVRDNNELSARLSAGQKLQRRWERRFKFLAARSASSASGLQGRDLVSSAVRVQSLSDRARISSMASQLSACRLQLASRSQQNVQWRRNYRVEQLSSCRNRYQSLANTELSSGRSSLSSQAKSLSLRFKRSNLSHSLGAVYGVSNASHSAAESDGRYRQETASNFDYSGNQRNFSNSRRLNYVPVVIIISVIVVILLIFILPFLKL